MFDKVLGKTSSTDTSDQTPANASLLNQSPTSHCTQFFISLHANLTNPTIRVIDSEFYGAMKKQNNPSTKIEKLQ